MEISGGEVGEVEIVKYLENYLQKNGGFEKYIMKQRITE